MILSGGTLVPRTTARVHSEVLEYRQKSPVLSVAGPNDRQPRERLCYVSGWFCNNAACEYRELAG